MSAYHLESGGKRFRGRLALAHAQTLSVPFTDAMKWAIACEILHNATLVHDDIQDEDPLRRGVESLWQKFGTPQAINAGDYLIFKAFEQIGTIEIRRAVPSLISCLARKSQGVAQGQALEIHLCQMESTNFWQTYLKIAELKTGTLFQAPIAGIELLSGLSEQEVEEKTSPWLKLGIAYQINDDINDFLGKKQEGQALKDFFEQKINSLVAWLTLKNENLELVNQYLRSECGSDEHIQSIRRLCKRIKQEHAIEELSTLKNQLYHHFCENVESHYPELMQSFVQQDHSIEEFNEQSLSQI